MKNYYAVRVGYNTGIYDYLQEAQSQIRGYPGAEMKGFNRLIDAQHYLYEHTNKKKYFVYMDLIFDNVRECQKYCNNWFEYYEIWEAQDHVLMNYHTYHEKFTQEYSYEDGYGTIIYEVYTDGACRRNGRPDAQGGIGVYFGANNPDNFCMPLSGSPQTNQRAELMAIKEALLKIKSLNNNRQHDILSDSEYAINCLTIWPMRWSQNGWRNAMGGPVANLELIKSILDIINTMHHNINGFYKVDAHSNCEGNNRADELARQGCGY